MPDVPDLTDFEQATSRAPGCGVVTFLAGLDERGQADVVAAMDAPVTRINHEAIRKVCQARGYPHVPSPSVFGYHRRGACSCPRPAGD